MNEPQLGDSISYIIADDSNVLCFENLDEEFTIIELPTISAPRKHEWKNTIKKHLSLLLGNGELAFTIHKMTKIWVPEGPKVKYIMNVMVLVRVANDFRESYVPPDNKRNQCLKWLNVVDLIRLYLLQIVNTSILPELFPLLHDALTEIYSFKTPADITDLGSYCELNNSIFKKLTGNETVDCLIKEAALEASMDHIYTDFLLLVYPNILMCMGKFKILATNLGFSSNDSEKLFRCADLTTRGFLTFPEFLGICIAIEPVSQIKNDREAARATYVYRYLNTGNDGMLTLKELRELVVLIRESRDQPVDSVNVGKEFKALIRGLDIANKDFIELSVFLEWVRSAQLPGIYNILKSSKSFQAILPVLEVRRSLKIKYMDSSPFPPKNEYCRLGKEFTFEIAPHATKVLETPRKITIESVFTRGSVPALKKNSSSIPHLSGNDLLHTAKYLAEINNVQVGNKGNVFEQYQSTNVNRVLFAQNLITICNTAAQLFAKEPRLLEMCSPICVFGDLHGNFGDFLYYERIMWPLGIPNTPFSILFLGDYVDRGMFSIELLAYMLGSKVLYPTKFYMLRGNHELREVQQNFTFTHECMTKFGTHHGGLVWEAVNNCFDYMPIAAVIDSKLFCCHGGIPPPWLCRNLDVIRKIPLPLSEPSDTSPLAWDILWNDPICKGEELCEEVQVELAANKGFAKNRRRGTAHVFDMTATMEFLRTNNLSHVIRAHEYVNSGFRITHQGHVISIFSTSNYMDEENDSACLQIENNSIQIVRFTPTEINTNEQ